LPPKLHEQQILYTSSSLSAIPALCNDYLKYDSTVQVSSV